MSFEEFAKMSMEKEADYRNPSLATLNFDALGPLECVTRWSADGGTVEVTGITQSKIEVIYRTSFSTAIKTGLLKIIKNKDSCSCL